jgi:MoaA/NifB/PqqE/SkfB family radical SAM enzyme
MINDKNKDTWCVNAVHGMSGNNDGSTKMCCMAKGNYGGDNNFEKISILENFNNSTAIRIRENLDNGIRDPNCTLCWQEEDGGRNSKRIRDNNRYNHEVTLGLIKPYQGLAKIELNLGNTCNIKCRTCSASISSTWMKEDYDLTHKRITFKEYSANMKKYHQTYDEDSPFWEDLKQNLSTIRQFDFYGGEPFLSKKMWEILKICVEKGYAKDIELHYNTNGTNWPDDVELFKNFKSVNLSFSIDGINERFEYMRYPAIWLEVKENMKKAVAFNNDYKNLSLSWCITLSNLNIFYLPEILDEHYSNWTEFGFYLNLVHGPKHYNISIMPTDVKDKVLERLDTISKSYTDAWYHLQGIIGFIKNGNYNEKEWNNFINVGKAHDEYRKQDYNTTFEEFGKIIHESAYTLLE